MPGKRYKLPNLAFFQGFEAAARTLTFTKAAEELFITQSAVSRQIKALRTISALSCLSDGRGHSR